MERAVGGDVDRDEAGSEPSYPLGVVVRMTGLSEHVIRAWERRYGAVSPVRTPGGTRRYTEQDVARLQLLRKAVDAGHRIGDIARLSDEALQAQVGPVSDPGPATPLDEIRQAVDSLDARALEAQLGLQLSLLGPVPFARRVAVPLLSELGERWARGELSVAAEHLVTSTTRSLFGMALHAGSRTDGAPRVLLATPAGERHEFGLLVAALTVMGAGGDVVYLGPDLPAEEVAAAAGQTGAAAVGLSIVNLSSGEARRYVRDLRRRLPEATALWVGGSAAGDVDAADRLDLEGLERRVGLLLQQGGHR